MLVFDASKSMATPGRSGQQSRRIDEAREALSEVLPKVTKFRPMGLVAYGPGPKDSCSNIRLHFAPVLDSASRISATIGELVPDGDTPLTESVRLAATALDPSETASEIVLVTDGGETCGGDPCTLAGTLQRERPDITVHVIGFHVSDAAFWSGMFEGTGPFE